MSFVAILDTLFIDQVRSGTYERRRVYERPAKERPTEERPAKERPAKERIAKEPSTDRRPKIERPDFWCSEYCPICAVYLRYYLTLDGEKNEVPSDSSYSPMWRSESQVAFNSSWRFVVKVGSQPGLPRNEKQESRLCLRCLTTVHLKTRRLDEAPPQSADSVTTADSNVVPRGVTLGKEFVAIWKRKQGRSREWRRRPFRDHHKSDFRGLPEALLKRYQRSGTQCYISQQRLGIGKPDKSSPMEDLGCVEDFWITDQTEHKDEAWMPESVKGRLLPEDPNCIIPYESYIGSILGQQFLLGRVMEDNWANGVQVYIATALSAPERYFIAWAFDFKNLPKKLADSRKRRMKRLCKRKGPCEIDQAGRKFLVYEYDNTASLQNEEWSVADGRAPNFRAGGWTSDSKMMDTDFPPLSPNRTLVTPESTWKRSTIESFFKGNQSPNTPSIKQTMLQETREPFRTGHEMIDSKPKRHRWKKSKKITASERIRTIEETIANDHSRLEEPTKTAVTEPFQADVSFSSISEMEKRLEIQAEMIANLVKEQEEWRIQALPQLWKCQKIRQLIPSLISWPPASDHQAALEEAQNMLVELGKSAAAQQLRSERILNLLIQHHHLRTRAIACDRITEYQIMLQADIATRSGQDSKVMRRMMKTKSEKAVQRLDRIHQQLVKEGTELKELYEDTHRQLRSELAGDNDACHSSN